MSRALNLPMLIKSVFIFGGGVSLATSAQAKYLLTAQYGQYYYFGDSLTAMNNRISSSATLDAQYKFGRAKGFVTSMQFNLGKSAFVVDSSISRFSESYAFSSSEDGGPEVKTSFTGLQGTVSIGTQIFPVKVFRKRGDGVPQQPAASSKNKSRREFYSNAFVGVGVFNGTHNYHFLYANRGTDIDYSTTFIHTLYGGTWRLGIGAIPNLDFITDVSVYYTSKRSSTHTLRTFTVEQQDQRYAPQKAKLSSLTDSPFQIIRIALGLAFTP